MKSFFAFLFSFLVFATGIAQAAEISSDGSKLLVEEDGCVTSVYDLRDGSKLLYYYSRSTYTCRSHPSFSADGRYLAANSNGYIIVYDFKTKDVINKIPSLSDVGTLRFSPDGKYLAIANESYITIKDFISGKDVSLIYVKPQIYQISEFTFTSNTRILVGDRFEGNFVGFDIVSGDPDGKFKVDSFSPWLSEDGQYICTYYSVFSSEYGEKFENLPPDENYPTFSVNSQFLATTSRLDGDLVRVYQWPQLKEISRVYKTSSNEGMKLVSDDGKLLFTYSQQHVTAWDLQTGQKLWDAPILVKSLRLTPDSSTLVTVYAGHVEVRDARTGVLKFKAH